MKKAHALVMQVNDQIDLEVGNRCRILKRKAEDLMMSLDNALEAELRRLHKRVRGMPMHEFITKYNGRLDLVKQSDWAEIEQSFQADTPRQLSLRNRTVACTPTPRSGKITTPARRLKTVGVATPVSVKGSKLSFTPMVTKRNNNDDLGQARSSTAPNPDKDGAVARLLHGVIKVEGTGNKDQLKAEIATAQAHLAALMSKIEPTTSSW